MKKLILIIAIAVIATSLFAQENRQRNSEKVDEARVEFFNRTLQLSDKEKEIFWPAYNNYRSSIQSLRGDKNGKPRLDLMSDAEVEVFIDSIISKEEKKIGFKKELYNSLKGKMSVRKLAALPQTEQKFKKFLLNKVRNERRGEGRHGESGRKKRFRR